MAGLMEVCVPDIGDFEDVEVIEILVGKGDPVEVDDSLVTLESDKATMEIPAPLAGEVHEVRVSLGDKVSEGSVLIVLSAADAAMDSGVAQAAQSPEDETAAPEARAPRQRESPSEPERTSEPKRPLPGEGVTRPPPVPPVREEAGPVPHASPLVRGFARGLGVDLSNTQGTGPSGRILEDDVRAHVRESLASMDARSGLPAPAQAAGSASLDFARFGPVEEVPLSKIRRATGRNLSRSWQAVPHVTQHDEADITELEAYRRSAAEQLAKKGLKLSPLLFVMKAVAVVLRELPDFRSSLAGDGQHLIRKGYFHLGIAVDTEHGLVVPVVRDVDQKGISELAAELGALAQRARERKLTPGEMQGSCFTISSLGGIGGTAFTPIVNAPEVAVLGLSRMRTAPRWSAGIDLSQAAGGAFEPRLILPFALSYDHRVIDGAAGARFTARLAEILGHPMNLLL